MLKLLTCIIVFNLTSSMHAIRRFGTIIDDTLIIETTGFEKIKKTKETLRIAPVFKEGLTLDKIPKTNLYFSSAVFVSDILETKFPFNSIGIYWKSKTPPETDIKIEVKLIEDITRIDETEWTEVEVYSDAMENPETRIKHPDTTFGSLLFLPEATGRYIQFRVTLSTNDDKKTPILKRLSFNYMDTTQGPSMEDIIKEIEKEKKR